MSDIYLQITETPTVVTLSAPVVSTALAATVTVANVVSVNVVTMPSISVQAPSVTTVIGSVTLGASTAQIGSVTVGNSVTIGNFPATQAVSLAVVPTHGVTLTSTTVTVSSLPAISGTVTASGTNGYGASIPLQMAYSDESFANGNRLAVSLVNSDGLEYSTPLPVSGTVTANINLPNFAGANGDDVYAAVQIGYYDQNYEEFRKVSSIDSPLPVVVGNLVEVALRSTSSLPAGTNRIGVVTIGAGTVTIGAGTAQIGSVTASISGTVPISISSVTVGNSVTIGSCVTHGVTISNTVVTFFPAQGTTVANSNFTSITASTSLVSADSGREVLTVFNEGAGNLHISPGATCTTVAYQVRLSAGDYWECPAGQLTLAHTAVFATAGTARVTQVS